MPSSDSLPVLIIGAGLGGLTLANSLQKYGIPYRIFERDSEVSQRAQGYRVSIDGSAGGAGLKAALSPELFDEFRDSCGESAPIGGRLDGKSGRLVAKGLMGYIGAGGWDTVAALAWRLLWKRWDRARRAGLAAWLASWVYTEQRPLSLPYHEAEYKVDRRIARTVLLTGQEQYITYNAAFESYTIEDESGSTPGSVTAYFADGTSAVGSLLVGSDGNRSKVTAQLLGANANPPLDLGARVVYGKTPLTPELDAAKGQISIGHAQTDRLEPHGRTNVGPKPTGDGARRCYSLDASYRRPRSQLGNARWRSTWQSIGRSARVDRV